MSTFKKIIDINAHIENLHNEIITENGIAIARISFTNLGYGNITAIKFSACGYDAFGEIVSVNGKDDFFLSIQGIRIQRNKSVVGLIAQLPNPYIMKLDLKECQICYEDGRVVSYEGENSLTFELDKIDNEEQLNALHKLYDKNAKFKPKEFEQGWVCSCGRFNKYVNPICLLCKKSRTDTIETCTDEGLEKLVNEYKTTEENDKLAREAAQNRQKKKNRKVYLFIALGMALIFSMTVFVYVDDLLSYLTTYSSENEMREELQGTWTCFDEGLHPDKIHIEDEILIKRWVFSDIPPDDLEFQIEKWYPKIGMFKVSGKIYMVLSNGKIRDDKGNLYTKWGDMSINAAP